MSQLLTIDVFYLEFLLNERVEHQEVVMFGVDQDVVVIYHHLHQGDLVVMLGIYKYFN